MGVSLRCWLNRGGVGGGVQATSSWLLDVEASAALAAAATTTTTSAVAVMAPALTEAGPQKPENLLPTGVLPSGGFLSADEAKQVCLSASTVHPKTKTPSNAKDTTTICNNHEVLAQFVVSANVQPSEIDERCLHGIPKDLINDVINFKFGASLDGLSDLIEAVLPRKEVTAASVPVAVAKTPTTNCGAAIMSDPSMGDDPADSMCIFKSIMGPGEADESCEISDIVGEVAGVQGVDDVNDTVSPEKQSEEERTLEEQIMGFAADLNVPSIGVSNVEEQIMGLAAELNAQSGDVVVPNVDDLLQVIKSFEPVESGENRLVDGCRGIVEASSQGSASEGVPEIFADGEGFPINLLNDVIGMCNDNLGDGGVGIDPQVFPQEQLVQPSLTNQVDQMKSVAETRHHQLGRRLDFLMRRCRKLQTKLMGEHVAEEIGNVLEEAQKSAKKAFQQDLASLGPKAGSARNFPELAGNMSSFFQKVSKTCNALGNSIAVRQRNSSRYFGAGSKDNYINSSANRGPVFGVPQIKLDGEKVEKVFGSLATKLKIVQNACDSDCTASSSGGESCDEMQTFNNPHQQQLTIAKRAAWQWAKDRSNVASRWTWLQAQISDLEFKIRQHTDLQQKIRAAKGQVMLEPSPTSSGAPHTPSLESTVNGYSGILPGSSHHDECSFDIGASTSTSPSLSSSSACGASRTRPYIKPLFRKRKLLQIDGLHEISKKASRPTNLKCTCDGIRAPCGLCTGRKEPMIDQEAMDLLSIPERVAAIDPGFHSVLSFPDEITHTVHINAIMRSTDWQQKMLRGGLRMTKLKDTANERRGRKVAEHRNKYQGRLKKSQTNLVSAKIKRKVLKDKRSRSSSERSNHSISRKRTPKYPQHSTIDEEDEDDDEEEEEASAFSSSSKYSSPVPSPMQHPNTPAGMLPEKNTLKEKFSYSNSRARTNSYDIDNIVIPQSMAAAARPEKLLYKEIEIPKWRVIDLSKPDVNNGAMPKTFPDNDVEDISDETIARRHERSEKEEFKRFSENAKKKLGTRRRRTESKMDSGTNTPDPMSPHTSDFGGDTMSPITSPPATPLNLFDEQSQSSDAVQHRSGAQNASRRRPSTRSLKEEATNATSFNEKEPKDNKDEEKEKDKENDNEKIIPPYEPRIFPLSEIVYQEMLGVMPAEHLQPSASNNSQEVKKVEEVDDHESDSTESALNDMETEDPNDPEWTVAEARETEKDRIRPTAKR